MTTSYYILKALKKSKSEFNFREHFSRTTIESFVYRKDEINSRCRVCLNRGTVDIFSDPITDKIVEALQTIAGVEVAEFDNRSKMLCNICHEFIKTALLFRKTAKRSEEILKQSISKITVKVEAFEESLDDEPSHIDSDNNKDQDVCNAKPSEALWATSLKTDEIKKEKQDKTKCSSKVTCPICKKVIKNKYFKEHAALHSDNKKFVCDVCGKSFRQGCAYYNHMVMHRNYFPYRCTLCPYQGRYSTHLKTHMRTHTGDYSYLCTECPAKFLFQSNLHRHMFKHKEPEFKCDTCNRAFHSMLILQRHKDVNHLGIKNHVCNICGKAFGYRKAMMKHQLSVHKREKLNHGRLPAYLAEKKQSDCNNEK